MNKTIKAALITGVATIITGFIGGMGYGKSSEQKNIQNEIQSVMGNVINVTGNDNQVTINSIKDLVDEYQRLQSQNQSLLEQNSKYFSDLSEANYQINALQSKTNELPEIRFNDLSLLIDVQDIPINKNNSMVSIDGRDYFSREIVESLIPDGQNFTIKDNTLFIGKVIAEKANLFDQWVTDSFSCDYEDAINDSLGNTCTKALVLWMRGGNVTYNLSKNYSYLKFKLSSFNEGDKKISGIITIKADEDIIYTSPTINIYTETIDVDIPINNCSTLTITGTGKDFFRCIISEAIVYN